MATWCFHNQTDSTYIEEVMNLNLDWVVMLFELSIHV